MRLVQEEPIETVHIYVVPENELPSKPDYLGILITAFCSLFLFSVIGLSIFSINPPHEIFFNITITGFRLPSVMKTMKITIQATGKGHVNSTYAHGEITFYNGQTYTQIIPINTILKGADGVSIITDSKAVIPPAAQTIPPTYGQTSVLAHSITPGAIGNIQAGDINESCCVTSVIAQNPYNFSGGKKARDFTFLSKQDVTGAVASLAPMLQQETQALFRTSIVLNPTCSTTYTSSLAVGQEGKSTFFTLKAVCTAISYSETAAKHQIVAAGEQYQTLTNIQFSIVGISEKKGGVSLKLYVTALVKPIVHTRYGTLVNK